MKLFIWERLDDVTSNWHTEAGVVVIAEDIDAARVAMPQAAGKQPDAVYDVGQEQPRTFVFPDAGCC